MQMYNGMPTQRIMTAIRPQSRLEEWTVLCDSLKSWETAMIEAGIPPASEPRFLKAIQEVNSHPTAVEAGLEYNF